MIILAILFVFIHVPLTQPTLSQISLPFSFDKLSHFFHSIGDEVRFRQSSFTQYRNRLNDKYNYLLEKFTTSQLAKTSNAAKDFGLYLTKFNDIYNDTMTSLNKQRLRIQELELELGKRPKQIDESLERFRKFYDESLSKMGQTFHSTNSHVTTPLFPPLITEKFAYPFRFRFSWHHPFGKDDFAFEPFESFSHQIDLLRNRLVSEWRSLTHYVLEPLQADKVMKSVLLELQTYQTDIFQRASMILQQSQKSLKNTMTKQELLQEKIKLDLKLKNLERSMNLWIESKIESLEMSLKAIQDKLNTTNLLYEELVNRRQSEVQYSHMNDVTLRKVLSLIDSSDSGWKHIITEDGVQVYRKFLDGPNSQYACVMCNGTVHAPPRNVLSLLEDPYRMGEYNSLFEQGKDLAVVADNTRIFYSTSPAMFPLKPRDFCTVIHVRKLRDGTAVIINRAVEHPAAPVKRNFVRASVVLAAQIIQPLPSDSSKTHITMITQVNPGGFAPAPLVNHLCTLGPIGFMKNVEVAANKSWSVPKRHSTISKNLSR